MIILILLISFVLDSIVSNLVPLHSLFTPLFSIVSLIVVYPFFYGDKKKFLIYSGIYGFLYDIVYTNTIFVNTFAFVLVSLVIALIYNYITVNKINFSFINALIILFYQSINYLLLCLVNYTNFNENTFFMGLYSSLILNIIYGLILYILTLFIVKKYKIRYVE